MENFFIQHLGIEAPVFNYVILPILIFMARISDVSIATVRIMFVMSGKKYLAPILGFFESFIWLVAIGQIIQNISNPLSYIAYAGGFATGTYVGMYIEEKLALGTVVVRIITKAPAFELINFFRNKNYRFSSLDAEGNEGKVNVLFTVVKREQLPHLIPSIKVYNPKAFYTIESVKRVSDDELAHEEGAGLASRFLNLKRR